MSLFQCLIFSVKNVSHPNLSLTICLHCGNILLWKLLDNSLSCAHVNAICTVQGRPPILQNFLALRLHYRGSHKLQKAHFQQVQPRKRSCVPVLCQKTQQEESFFIFITAAANKLLHIYYASIKECLNAAESTVQAEEN